MYSAISHSINLLDMIIWAVLALILQILVYLVLRLLFNHLIKDVADDKIGPAIFLAIISIVVGLLAAACITY